MKHIEGVILDWAGTTVDFGCFAPVEVFIKVFENAGIAVTMDEARAPMGMLKIDHIRAMLNMQRIGELWFQKYGRLFNESDVQHLFNAFEPMLMHSLKMYTDPLPNVVETVSKLRQMGLKIGSTTGYNNHMMGCVTHEASRKGYTPDCWITPDETSQQGRPFPYMIFRNMETLKITSPWNLIKVGDTLSDIEEGLCAGAWSVGIATGSSVMGLSEFEFYALSDDEKRIEIERCKKIFKEHGAHFAIDSISDLPMLIKEIDEQRQSGLRP